MSGRRYNRDTVRQGEFFGMLGPNGAGKSTTGVFYSIASLPPIWQQLSRLNPVLYLVNIFRYSFLGVFDVMVATSFFFLIGFTAARWFFCLWVLRRGVGLRT